MTGVINLQSSVQSIVDDLADPDAPRLGVHTISEFMFCRRAGIVVLDQKTGDSGSEFEPAPALSGLPTHEIDEIRRAMTEILYRLKFPVAWNVFTVLCLFCAMAVWGLLGLIVLGPAQYYSYQWLKSMLLDYSFLSQRLKSAKAAAVQEPNWELPLPQAIHWWSLIRAGFVSVEKRQTLEDPVLGVAGRPWRVLNRGSFGFPVMRIRVDDQQHDRRKEGRLHPNQLARIAAYSYLMNRLERADSSWAIVLFGDSDEGVAIPITPEVWNSFHEGLIAARRRTAEYRTDPLNVPNMNSGNSFVCAGCPFGKPRRLGTPSVFLGAAVAPFGTSTVQGTVYHCTCGDRFKWVPPHQEAKRLGLTQ